MKTLLQFIILLALMGLTQQAHAFSAVITSAKPTIGLNSKVITVAGTYKLSAGESIVAVHVVTLDANQRQVSAAQGNWGSGRWSAAVGDFRMVYWKVVFTVSQNGSRRTFSSPVYRL